MEPVALAGIVRLDAASGTPLVTQIYRSIHEAVTSGRLPSGGALPSSRRAAEILGVGRNTVVTAYDLLVAEGVIDARPGAVPRVRDLGHRAIVPTGPALIVPSRRGQALAAVFRTGLSEGRLAPGSPDPRLFDADAWALALRRASRRRLDGAEGYEHYEGLPELRAVLADHLRRHRGLVADPEQILITPGTQASLTLLAQALADPGDVALIESPGYAGARGAFHGAGLECLPLPVDEAGADITRAPVKGARLIYVTPSTQYPTGIRMTLPRRLELIEHARVNGAVIAEDDYDSEFVWHGREIPALQALAPEAGVVYLGSAAKSLLPGMRIGWIVAPLAVLPVLSTAHRRLGLAANVQAQAALADLMSSGTYRAQLRRVSRAYEERAVMLSRAMECALAGRVQVSRPAGGLQLTVRLPQHVDEGTLCQRLWQEGFAVAALSEHCLGSLARGFVVGFGTATEKDSRQFAGLLQTLNI